jgi:glutamate carboxypeptidase
MKAGIVQAIHAVASLDDRSGIEILMTCDEEVGAATSKELLCQRALACGAVLVLEPSADGGALKTGRKGVGTFEVQIAGRAAHAGLEPHLGINSVVEAAHQLLVIAAIADPALGTTVTPTVIQGGTTENVVPAATSIKVDVRVSTMEEAARVEAAMAALKAVIDGAAIEVLGRISRPPLPESASAELFPMARAHDPEITGISVGGGSDGNFTAALGVPTLDGLGAVGGGAHADTEHVLIETMPPRAALLRAVLSARLAP